MSKLSSALDTVSPEVVYDLYRREGAGVEIFAIGESGPWVAIVEVARDGTFDVKTSGLQKAVGQLATRLKQGFLKQPRAMYFNARSGTFTAVHPDLDWKGAKWLLAASPRDMEGALKSICELVGALGGGLILPEEIGAWREQQEKNQTHLVAFSDHPAWCLALGQLALNHGWSLRSNADLAACPDAPPSTAPLEWESWLSPAFDRKAVVANMAGFGWTVGQLIVSESNRGTTANDLSALI